MGLIMIYLLSFWIGETLNDFATIVIMAGGSSRAYIPLVLTIRGLLSINFSISFVPEEKCQVRKVDSHHKDIIAESKVGEPYSFPCFYNGLNDKKH